MGVLKHKSLASLHDTAATLLGILLQQAPEYVIYSPFLPDAVLGLPEPLLLEFLDVGGTALLLRMMKTEESPLSEKLAAVYARLTTPDARATLIALWPRVIKQALAQEEDEDMHEAVTDVECPIMHMPMVDPVLGSDGHTYERDAILRHLLQNATSPMTRGSHGLPGGAESGACETRGVMRCVTIVVHEKKTVPRMFSPFYFSP